MSGCQKAPYTVFALLVALRASFGTSKGLCPTYVLHTRVAPLGTWWPRRSASVAASRTTSGITLLLRSSSSIEASR